MNDFRYAFRQVVNRPGLSVIIVLMLALGIGATTAMYSIYQQILFQPLPVSEPERLVNLGAPGPKWGMTSCSTSGPCEQVFSYPMFRDLERDQQVFSNIAAHRNFGANLSYEGQTLAGSGMLVSGGYFSTLGLTPALGRLIGPQDEPRVDESAVVVLSHNYWQNQFGGDPGIIGRVLNVNGQPLEIIGVAPRGFIGTTLGYRPQVFVPLTMTWRMMPTFPRNDTNRTAYWLYLFARLPAGMSIEQADAGINPLYNGILNEIEVAENSFMPENVLEQFRERRISITDGARGQSGIRADAVQPLSILLGVTGLVLLIVCVNIANLLLSRSATRSAEMAVRASVGASRWQMARQMLAESGVLAVFGLLCSTPVAVITLGAVLALLPQQLLATFDIGINLTSLAFAAVLTVSTVLLFGLVPAWQASRTDPGSVLKAQSGRAGGGVAMARFRGALAVGQVALSMVLLVLAGLFTQSLANVSRVDLGLDTDSVITFSVSPRLNGYTPERTMQVYERIEEELAALPGVISVTSSMVPILSGNNWSNSLNVEGFEAEPGTNTNASVNAVSTEFFSTFRIPILRGRDVALSDHLDAPGVALVNEAFVRKFEMGDDVVGRRFGTGGSNAELDITIIGVVGDAKYSEVKDDVPAQYFLARRQDDNLGTMNFYLRTAMSPDDMMATIPRVVALVDPDLPVSQLMSMDRRVQENVFLDRMMSTLSAAFAVLATLLAAIGLYGVLAYSVEQRTREIGLRLALGAAPSTLRVMVLRQVGWMSVIGGVIGVVGAYLLGRYAEALLFGLGGFDLTVMVGAVVALGLVVMLAGYLPARRASRVHPMEALRYE